MRNYVKTNAREYLSGAARVLWRQYTFKDEAGNGEDPRVYIATAVRVARLANTRGLHNIGTRR